MENAALVPPAWLISSRVELFVQRTRIAVALDPPKFGATVYVRVVVASVPLPPLPIETNGSRLSEPKEQFSPEVLVTIAVNVPPAAATVCAFGVMLKRHGGTKQVGATPPPSICENTFWTAVGWSHELTR